MKDLATVDPGKLQPSPELDALIAEWTEPKPKDGDGAIMDISPSGWWKCIGPRWIPDKEPSTNPAHAGEARRKAEGYDLHTFNAPDPTIVSCGIRVGEEEVYVGGGSFAETNGDKGKAEALGSCRAITCAMRAAEAAGGE